MSNSWRFYDLYSNGSPTPTTLFCEGPLWPGWQVGPGRVSKSDGRGCFQVKSSYAFQRR